MLGTGFTVDTPVKVARYGISSVISLVDDVLLEQMRRRYCLESGEPYEPIGNRDDDARARRITAWLNLVDRLVGRQMDALIHSSFDPGGDLARHFEMLPASPLRDTYERMTGTSDPRERSRLEADLRKSLRPGAIDVNIMTKLDGDAYRRGKAQAPEFRAAMAALRGFALSTLRSSIVFSAGINPGLYSYAAQFPDFFSSPDGDARKTIIVKVSDFRSAVTQGKFLAKRGLWVSEFRIESGLNCGGHAFATRGHLMGPILEQFLGQRNELIDELHGIYAKALAARGVTSPTSPRPLRVTAQGGIGTNGEHEMLLRSYDLASAGWGTPFLLVPEVTNVDEVHLRKLAAATDRDVVLSRSSPLGVPFWNLRTSAAEERRLRRIDAGRPGSPCTKGYLATNVEFSKRPICTASRAYQKQKLEEIKALDLPEPRRAEVREAVLEKACICHDLSGGAAIRHGIDPNATPAVCCGPNIVNFNRVVSLREMIDHIYGRRPLPMDAARPHVFVRELMLYADHLEHSAEGPEAAEEFRNNLRSGIDYYRARPDLFGDGHRQAVEQLERLRERIAAAGVSPPEPSPSLSGHAA